MDLKGWRFQIYSKFWETIDHIFPPVCLGCDKVGEYFCEDCKEKMPTITYHYSEDEQKNKISEHRDINDVGTSMCDETRAFAYHEGAIKKAVHRLKYERDLGLGKVLGKMLVPIVQEHKWDIDLIIPVPLGRKRRKERGYNQAEIIAFPLAHYLKIRFDPNIIKRCRETKTQIGLSKRERHKNVDGVFVVENGKVEGKSVLLLDDVYTSGATMKSAGKALKEAGARCVYTLTVTKADNLSANEIW